MIKKDIFLPYTAFHVASAIRTLRAEQWRPEHVIIIRGFGTTHSASGKLYLKAFRKELADRQISHTEIDPKQNIVAWTKEVLAITSRNRLITGNPRRIHALFFSSRVGEIMVVDEGSGTTRYGGYFDPSIPEKSKLKQSAINFRALPDYRRVFKKISKHPTVFDLSIFPNPVRIPFQPAMNLPADTMEISSRKIFVSSDMKEDEIPAYARWATNRFSITSDILLSVHPSMSEKLTLKLAKALRLPVLCTNDLLLEEYAYGLAVSGIKVSLMGQENSSTLLLRDNGHDNIDINCDNWVI